MSRYTHRARTFIINLREDLLTKNKAELLRIAKANLYVEQDIDLFWHHQPGQLELYHPRLTFGTCQKVCEVLDKDPILTSF